jgi:hypothetical protein
MVTLPAFFILFIFILGLGGSLLSFFSWVYHDYKYPAILLWSLGLLCLDWYQIPTLMALSGVPVVLSNFNPFFSLALPISFLGFGLICLGSFSIISRVRPIHVLLLAAWFVAALIFYGFYYDASLTFQTIWPIIDSNILFFAPMFLLNCVVGIRLYRRTIPHGSRDKSLKIGLGAYVLASCCGLVRCGTSIFFGLTHRPDLATLSFFSPVYITAQVVGLILFLFSFYIIHKNIPELSRNN